MTKAHELTKKMLPLAPPRPRVLASGSSCKAFSQRSERDREDTLEAKPKPSSVSFKFEFRCEKLGMLFFFLYVFFVCVCVCTGDIGDISQ